MSRRKSGERISDLEIKVAELLSERGNISNESKEDLCLRISKLETQVSQLTSMNEALVNLTNYLQVDVANLKSDKRKADLVDVEEVTPKKRKLASNPPFRGGVFDDSEAVEVYTDGSCFNNGRHDACAGIGVYWGPNSEDNVSESLPGRQTNNRAEIYAAIRAIQQAIAKNIKNLIIHTDSQFLINCITKWIHSWKKNRWMKSDGGAVINKEELQELDDLLVSLNVKWVHVDGHSGIPGNEAADKLAVQGAQSKKKNNNENYKNFQKTKKNFQKTKRYAY